MPHNAAAAGPQAVSSDFAASRRVMPGDEKYLWALVALEVLVMVLLRGGFKRHHGG